MSHKTRVERHITVDVLASVVGGAVVASLINKSLIALLLSAASGLVLFLVERSNIQEEDQLDSPQEVIVETLVPIPSLNNRDLEILRGKAAHPATEGIPIESYGYYMAGLEDGAAVTSQWVLNQVEE